MSEPIAYQDYIPTDKWSLQDWYLLKMVKIENIYTKIFRGWFGGGVDRRALIEFFSEVKGYQAFATENFKKHLSEPQWAEFVRLLSMAPEHFDVAACDKVMTLLGVFHWKSGLSKLSESKPLGPFAYARKQRGLGGTDEHNDGESF